MYDRRVRPSRIVPALAALAVTLAAAPARADRWPDLRPLAEAVVEAIRAMNFYSQLQIGAFAVLGSGPRPDGVGARAGFNALGFGASLGGRYEPYPAGGGGLGSLDLEFRPLPFFQQNIYRTFDPYLCAGGEIGFGSLGFRAAQTVGVGLDIGLFGRPDTSRASVHPVLALRYQFRTIQTQPELPDHLLHVGGALRLAF